VVPQAPSDPIGYGDIHTATRSAHPRAASPSVIAAEFAKWGIKPVVTGNVAKGLSQALSTAKEKDLVCVTGSLFIVAEALDYAAG